MQVPQARAYRLVTRGGAGLVCDSAGVGLGPVSSVDVSLDDGGVARFSVRPLCELREILDVAFGDQSEGVAERVHKGLVRTAHWLETGDLAQASLEAVMIGIPELTAPALAKLATPAWQSEPRVPNGQTGGGEWTDGAGGTPKPAAQVRPGAASAPKVDPTKAEKAKFVADHLAAARQAAAALKVPVENVLGVAGFESQWGNSRFANEGNNLFGMYYPAPFAIGFIPAKGNSKARLAKFINSDDSFRSFAEKYKPSLSAVSDPTQFVKILQDNYKFGIFTSNGKNVSTYVNKVSRTIVGLRSLIDQARTKSR